jgi:hypothetical protein
MLASKQIAFGSGKRGLSAKDYVQDGLIAMWDGIENAGWGLHDSNPIGWHELIAGNNVESIESYMKYQGNGYLGLNVPKSWNVGISILNHACIEACLNIRLGEDSSKGQNIITPEGYGYKLAMVIKPINDEPVIPLQYSSKDSLKVVILNTLIDKTVTVSIKNSKGWVNGVDSTSTISFSGYSGWSFCYSLSEKMAWGSRSAGNTNNSTACFLHNIRLYSRALTAEEVAHNYEIDKARFGL